MPNIDGFDGPELVLTDAPLRAYRSWQADELGRLTGVSFSTIWRPGENVARCGSAARPTARPGHMANCSCGFYGYFVRGRSTPGDVKGIMEYSGEVVVGTYGVRASRARVVALVDPRVGRLTPLLHPSTPAEWRRTWTATVLALLACVALTVFSTNLPGWLGVPLFVLGIVAFCVVLVATVTSWMERDDSYGRRSELRRRAALDRVRANYPDVPAYSSLAAARRRHPVKAPDLPPAVAARPTADDYEDFWTAAHPRRRS